MSGSSRATQKINRRIKYKELIEKGAKIGEKLENQNVLDSFNNIMELISICETVSTDYVSEGKVEHTSDYLMDASVIKLSHDLVGTTTEKMADGSMNEDEYVAVLLNLMGDQSGDKILEIAANCCRTATFQTSLLGTFSLDAPVIPKEIKMKRERQARKTLSIKKKPESVSQLPKAYKGAEKINMMRSEIERVLKQRRTTSIPYYELIVNPNDFMKTIDAAFQLSFLIRDGIFGLKRFNNEPHIVLKDSILSEKTQDGQASVQTVMTMDPKLWKKEIQKYKLKTPILHLNYEEEPGHSEQTSSEEDGDSDRY